MSYYLSMVDAAERKIRDAGCPVRLERSDYGFALYAYQGDNFWTLFLPDRSEKGWDIETSPEALDKLILEWKQGP